MAGIYKGYEEGNRFVILTKGANKCIRPVHDRMSVLLGKNEIEDWVFDESFMKEVLRQIPEELVRGQEYERQTFFV